MTYSSKAAHLTQQNNNKYSIRTSTIGNAYNDERNPMDLPNIMHKLKNKVANPSHQRNNTMNQQLQYNTQSSSYGAKQRPNPAHVLKASVISFTGEDERHGLSQTLY